MEEYKPSFLFRNHHVNTCYPTFFRKIEINYERQRVYLSNKDFLDFDWYRNGGKNLILLCHGLEGSSHSHYIKAFAKYFGKRSWDSLAINYRSCSGESNPNPYFYVSGKGDEIDIALQEAEAYETIILVGFSLGANKILDYLGRSSDIFSKIKGGVAVSPPCDLKESSLLFSKGFNQIYEKHFLRSLKRKLLAKEEKYPGIFKKYQIHLEKLGGIKTLIDFDHRITSQILGLKDAFEYYEKNSSLFVLKNIERKTLILTALDDPMMSTHCYPYEEVSKNPYLTLITPKYGGHISYSSFSEEYWLEKFVYEYIMEEILK